MAEPNKFFGKKTELQTSGIYKITNLVNNKIYIGSTGCFYSRWIKGHVNLLRINKHNSPHLQSAWNKYGETNFVFEVLENVTRLNTESKQDFYKRLVSSKEQFYLDTLLLASQPNNDFHKLGYNTCRVAGSSLGRKWKMSEESKQKIKKARLGISFSVNHKENIRRAKLGTKLSQDSIKKRTQSRKKNLRPVVQYTLKGELIKEWPYATPAGLALGYKNGSNISSSCKTGIVAFKYVWRYKFPKEGELENSLQSINSRIYKNSKKGNRDNRLKSNKMKINE